MPNIRLRTCEQAVDGPTCSGPDSKGLAFTNDELLFIGAQFRVVPSSPLSYVGWHYDVDRQNTPTHLKIQLYVEDVSADGGPFAFVPGSHKQGPLEHVLGADTAPHLPLEKYNPEKVESVALPARRGDVVFFSYQIIHWSDCNRTDSWRK